MLAIFRRLLGVGDPSKPKIDPGRLPHHIAIIMDGNGRWAQRRGLPRIAGHRAGAKVVREIVEKAADVGIDYLTLYAFSAENWRRPKTEVGGLMKLFEEILKSQLAELHENNVKIRVIGRLEGVAEGTRRQFEEAIEKTSGNTGLNLVVALNYSGRADILNAVDSLAAQAFESGRHDPVDEKGFSAALNTAGMPDPELVIRTSGEMRLSNFLIWEGAYAEFWATDTLWPDFTGAEFMSALFDYQRRERRFGGLADEKSSTD